jgi:succinate dehydrogenase/fumarate reductase-like Fe-S protein
MVEKMTEKTVNVTISRFDPSVDPRPYSQTYTVPIVEGMAVLQVLDYIYDNLDSTLSYHDHGACAQGICKQCTMLINQKPSLMCQTMVKGDIFLEPIPKFKVVKDLVYEKGRKKSE